MNIKHVLAFIMLAGVFGSAQAANISLTSADFPFSLGTDPTAVNSYSVSHSPGSFNDVYTFDLSQLSNTVSSAVSLFLPNFTGGASYNITGGTLSLFSDPGGDGLAGSNTLIASTPYGSIDGVLAVNNVATGHYFWEVSGTAAGTQGGVYLFSADTTPVPEPGTYALMLAGLGLLGFIAKHRSGQTLSMSAPFGMA